MKTINYDRVDHLGVLLAQIADLEVQAKAIKDDLKADGEGAYEGVAFRATVSIADRATLDVKAAKAKLKELGVDGRWFARHTTVTTVPSVKVVAKNGERIAA